MKGFIINTVKPDAALLGRARRIICSESKRANEKKLILMNTEYVHLNGHSSQRNAIELELPYRA